MMKKISYQEYVLKISAVVALACLAVLLLGAGGTVLYEDPNTVSKSLNFTGDVTMSANAEADSGFTIKGTSLTDLPTYGAELLTVANLDSLGAGWTKVGAGDANWVDGFTHVSGTDAITSSLAIDTGAQYQLSWTVSATPTSTFGITIGGYQAINTGATTALSATGSFGPTAISDGQLTITPLTGFIGTISNISLRKITAAASPSVSMRNSGGTLINQIFPGNLISNVFMGYQAGRYNTTGIGNTAIGSNAFISNTTGSSNAAFGQGVMGPNTTGSVNLGIGGSALMSNLSGSYNIAIGVSALRFNTTGTYNLAIGPQALRNNVANSRSTAIGYTAMYNADSDATGKSTYNTAIGYSALYGGATPANNTGTYNTAVGDSALVGTTSGEYNSAVGAYSLGTMTTGSNNVAVGYGAARYYATTSSVTAPTNSVYLGRLSKASGASPDNEIVIGAAAIGLGSNTTAIGVSGATTASTIYGTLALPNLGTLTGKADVQYDTGAAKTLGYVTSSRDVKENIVTADASKTSYLYDLTPRQYDRKDGSSTGEIGLIAEEVALVHPKMVCYDENGKAVTVSYSSMITPLLIEAQGMRKEITGQQTQIAAQLAMIKALEERLAKLEAPK